MIKVRSVGLNPYIIPLETTFADCENTTSEINIVTVTVPANTLGAGDIIDIVIGFRRLQNSGGSITFTQELSNNSLSMESISSSISNNSSEYIVMQQSKFIVSDITSDIVTLFATGFSTFAGTIITGSVQIALGASATSSGATTRFISNNTFDNTVGTTLKISAKWTTANANAWIRVQQAQAYIIKKAV